MSNKEIKMDNDPEWLMRQVRAEEELYAQGWNGCTSVGGSFITRKENISRFAKKWKQITNPIPRMGDTGVTPMIDWRNEDANVTKPSDFVKKWEREIPTYSPEVHAVLGQMMNDTIVKMRQEQAYKIWVSEDKPDGEQEELCPFCGKSYKIKDRHYWEAFVYIFLKNTCDWQMSVRLDKVVCDWFHHAI